MSEKSKLAIIGGIIINCEGTDQFLPVKFEIRGQNSSKDVFDAVFGKSSTLSNSNSD